MEAQQILRADLDDIIFERRNKAYGAYWLRKIYSKNMTYGGIITIAILLLGFGIPFLKSIFSKPEDVNKPVVTTVALSAPPPLDKTAPPPPPPNLPPPPPKTIKFTPPVIKPDEQVPPDQEPPPVEEMKTEQPAPVTSDANVQYNFNDVPQQAVEEPKQPAIFTYVEQMPEFPGGDQALLQFLQKNLRYPPAARENGIEGTEVVQFVVDESGNISDIQVLRDIGGGCADEATRVVKMMPPWKPGRQNGNAVKVYFKLPITFKLGTQ